VTTAAEGENQFLKHMPGEIKELLQWYADATSSVPGGQSVTEFAERFLGAIYEDGAAPSHKPFGLCSRGTRPGPTATSGQSSKHRYLAEAGFRTTPHSTLPDPRPRRLQSNPFAIGTVGLRSWIATRTDNKGKNIRVWTGMSFVYHMLGFYREEIECCSQALEADRSDPKLWLLYGFALKSAGREELALSIMNHEYDAYVRAGKPEELREAFADIQSTAQRPCRQRMA
jgi:hypothetical protein